MPHYKTQNLSKEGEYKGSDVWCLSQVHSIMSHYNISHSSQSSTNSHQRLPTLSSIHTREAGLKSVRQFFRCVHFPNKQEKAKESAREWKTPEEGDTFGSVSRLPMSHPYFFSSLFFFPHIFCANQCKNNQKPILPVVFEQAVKDTFLHCYVRKLEWEQILGLKLE